MDDTKKHICRVCLSTKKRKYVSLFEKHKDCYIFNYINSVTNVQIKENDGFPDKICRTCFLELETVISFKEKCEGSNVFLRNTSAGNSSLYIEIDVKNVLVKKEEPPEVESENPTECLEDDYFDNTDFCDIKEKKDVGEKNEPLNQEGTGIEGLRKSRVIDLKLKCDDCGGYFKSKCKLKVHWKKVHQPQKLTCTACKRRFKSPSAFARHQQNKRKNCIAARNFHIEGEGKNRVFYCKECDYKSLRIKDLITHWVTHTGDRPYKCDLCPTTCTQLSSLTAHKESVHQQYKVEMTCQYCGKHIRGRNKMYRHLKIHTDRGIACSVCNKVLKNKNSLSQHMNRHSGHKSYQCEKCAQVFYTMAELANHKRMVHNSGKQWFKCTLCEYKSARSECIKRHIVKHKDTNMPCTICGQFFENGQKLILHQRRHFEEKKYSCPYCEQKFFRRDSISKHVKAKHTGALAMYQRSVGLSVKDEGLQKRSHSYEDGTDTFVSEGKPKSVSPIRINGDM